MFRVLLLAFATLFLLSCGSQKSKDVAFQKVRLALAMQPTNGLTMVALEKGYFKAHGLDVEVSEHPSGKRAMHDALLVDKADIASAADVPIVKNAFVSDEVISIATVFSADNVNRIIARVDADIKTPQDLKGKRVATQYASAVHFFMHVFLLENGMDESELSVSYLKAEELPKALSEGKIDAFSMREPYISQAKNLLGENAIIFAAPGAYRQIENVITKKIFLKKNPELIKRYLLALLDAEKFTADNPEKAQQIIATRLLNTPNGKIKENWAGYNFRVALEQTSIILMEDIARWMLYQGIVKDKKVPNFTERMAIDPLKKYKPEAVNVIQ